MPTAFVVPSVTVARVARTRPVAEDGALLRAVLHSRRLVLLRALLDRLSHADTRPDEKEAVAGHRRLLEQADRHHPSAVRTALGHPFVGVHLVAALNAPAHTGPDELAAHLGAVAVAAALHARIGFRTTVRTRDGLLALPGVGAYRAGTPRVRLVAGPHSLRLTPEGRRTVTVWPRSRTGTAPAGWWEPWALPGGGARLEDACLDRATAAAVGLPAPRPHPWGPRAPRPWPARWRAALTLLTSADPPRAAEVAAQVRSLVPLPPAAGEASSATLRAAPWAVFTFLPETASRMAEVLVHELQHSKLAVLGEAVALHRSGGGAVHRVPWRRDPRPLGGVLQGAFAHLALADLWHRLAERPGATPTARKAARVRGEDYRAQVAEALPILRESDRLTPAGREFAAGLERHHAELGRHGAAPSRPVPL
ncbi:aKG-HExxH-type peptide beta-hydroxylase [Streptomyces megasporus]|uniref:aKG-HExxH-type peptide beta-hydroxylase n=1 Tax=Streptomyces megasporus TaxID=44060 RepID=UPI0012FEF213|nr:HEXXH motif-containing putative peptide modification protein [Streptomyces megasporus]